MGFSTLQSKCFAKSTLIQHMKHTVNLADSGLWSIPQHFQRWLDQTPQNYHKLDAQEYLTIEAILGNRAAYIMPGIIKNILSHLNRTTAGKSCPKVIYLFWLQ